MNPLPWETKNEESVLLGEEQREQSHDAMSASGVRDRPDPGWVLALIRRLLPEARAREPKRRVPSSVSTSRPDPIHAPLFDNRPSLKTS